MKRYGNIFEKIITLENIRLAHQNAKKDKLYYREVKMVDGNPEYYFKQIQDMLINKTYKVDSSDYMMFKKMDKGKEREIFKLDYFPHRIIQWALMLQIQDIMLKSFIDNTFASIPNRGIHLALDKLDGALKNKEETIYCLKLDVKKFYPSINQSIAKQQLRRKFKDADLLWLTDMLIDSMSGGKGIAIGSLFSQWLGNSYLSPLDHWIKEEKRVKYYFRYMDDIVILYHDKEYLRQMFKEIEAYMIEQLDLTVKENWQIFPTRTRGIDFVGYRHFGDYILLRKSTSKKLKNKMNKLLKRCQKGILMTYSEWCSVNSYKGWTVWCNGFNLTEKYIKPLEPYAEKYYREVIKK